jgi:DNA-directed RNA polymerase subunit alpha
MEIYIGRGRGYVSAERNKEINKDIKFPMPIGYIPVDSMFAPVMTANYNVEAARVGQSIGFDKLTLDVKTNGAFSGKEVISLAAKTLEDHIRMFVELSELGNMNVLVSREEDKTKRMLETPIEDLNLSVRSFNCLKRAGLQTIEDLTRKTEEDMLKVRNLGRKSLDEVIAMLEQYGFSLKAKEE